jgi:two-component system chemotaxis response regulator CheY
VALWFADELDKRPHKRGAPRAGNNERAGAPGILVVEDDLSILAMVKEILKAEGYAPIPAKNGAEALSALERMTPALVLLDMRMPVVDGWAVARKLKSAKTRIPVVVMTAAENAARWAEEIGAEGYLAKPFELQQLLDVVERYVPRQNRPN